MKVLNLFIIISSLMLMQIDAVYADTDNNSDTISDSFTDISFSKAERAARIKRLSLKTILVRIEEASQQLEQMIKQKQAFDAKRKASQAKQEIKPEQEQQVTNEIISSNRTKFIKVLQGMRAQAAAQILAQMPVKDAAQLIMAVKPKVASQILAAMPVKNAKAVVQKALTLKEQTNAK